MSRALYHLMLLGALQACAHVAPYEREHLSKPCMNNSEDARAASFKAHVHDSREGATGGQGTTGAGCGCN